MVMRDETVSEGRPRTRGECPPREEGFEHRRCGFVGCRHHLALTVHPSGRLGINERFKLDDGGFDLDALDREACCSLDVAERGGLPLRDVGDVLGVTYQRVGQIRERAKVRMIVNGSADLLYQHLREGEGERPQVTHVLVEERHATTNRKARERAARRRLNGARTRMTTVLAVRARHLEATANARAIEAVNAALSSHRERVSSPVERLARSEEGPPATLYDVLSPWSSLSAGQRARRLRLRLGWSIGGLAFDVGVYRSAVYKLEIGKLTDATERARVLTQVLAFLRVSDEAFLSDTRNGHPPLVGMRRPEAEPTRRGRKSNALRMEWLLGLSRITGCQQVEMMRRSSRLTDLDVDHAAGVEPGTMLRVELGMKVGAVNREKVLQVVMSRALV